MTSFEVVTTVHPRMPASEAVQGVLGVSVEKDRVKVDLYTFEIQTIFKAWKKVNSADALKLLLRTALINPATGLYTEAKLQQYAKKKAKGEV